MMNKKWGVILLSLILLNGCQSNIDSGIKCVPAGCSNQLCVNEDKAGGIVTTCEYREEYKCFEFSNCGYIDGECKWEETPEYLECLEGVN